MPIAELEKFRAQYPQYNDLDDVTLATKLAQKYPQYGDLVEKAQKADVGFTQKQLSSKIIPQFTKGLYENLPFGKRVISMLPNAEKIKKVQEATPSPRGILPTAGRIAGEAAPDVAMMTPFLGGASVLPKAPGIIKLATGVGAYAGTKAGLTEGPQRILPEGGKAFATTAALGYAGKGLLNTSKIVGKSFNYLRKSTADYVTTKVAPKAYQAYQEAVQKFTPQIQKFAEEKLKIPSSAINSVKKFGVDAINKIRQTYDDNVDPIVQKIEQGFANKRQLADKAYQQAISNPPKNFGGTVDVRDTVKVMDNVFKGSLGEATRGTQGNRLYLIRQELKARMPAAEGFYKKIIPTPTQLQRQLKGEQLTNISGEVRLSVKQFSELRDALNSLYRENPYDRNIAKVMNQLYTDGETSGLKGLQVARALQRQAFQAEENLAKKSLINQNKLNNFHKLTEAEKRQLKAIEQYTGENFVDDLDAITADRALDKLREYNPDRFANDFNKAIDPKWTEYVKKEYKDLLGDKTDEVFNEIVSHRRGIRLKKGLGLSGGLLAAEEVGRRGYRLLRGRD